MRNTLVLAATLAVALPVTALAQQPGVQPKNLEFQQLDTNKDGFISKQEAAKSKQISRQFAKADVNKDGKLDPAEFERAAELASKEVVDDSWITSKIKSKLLAAKGVPSTGISVTTADGIVTLAGTVKTREQIAKSGQIAKATKGVKSVRNELAVKS